jgi:hypothetical protein
LCCCPRAVSGAAGWLAGWLAVTGWLTGGDGELDRMHCGAADLVPLAAPLHLPSCLPALPGTCTAAWHCLAAAWTCCLVAGALIQVAPWPGLTLPLGTAAWSSRRRRQVPQRAARCRDPCLLQLGVLNQQHPPRGVLSSALRRRQCSCSCSGPWWIVWRPTAQRCRACSWQHSQQPALPARTEQGGAGAHPIPAAAAGGAAEHTVSSGAGGGRPAVNLAAIAAAGSQTVEQHAAGAAGQFAAPAAAG